MLIVPVVVLAVVLVVIVAVVACTVGATGLVFISSARADGARVKRPAVRASRDTKTPTRCAVCHALTQGGRLMMTRVAMP
jgi:hypothetical protein